MIVESQSGSCYNRRPDEVARLLIATQLDQNTLGLWRAFSECAIQSPYQTAEWYQAWLATTGAALGETPFIIMAFDKSDRQTILLPLVLVKINSLSICRFAGGKHSNFNFPMIRPGMPFTRNSIEILFKDVIAQCPSVDLFMLDSLPDEWDAHQNPLCLLRKHIHPAAASIIDLDSKAPSPSLASRPHSKRKRWSERKLTQLSARVCQMRKTDEIEQAIVSLFVQKKIWSRLRGLPEIFCEPCLSRFFCMLFNNSANAELFALRVDGENIAVAGLLTKGKRASLMFISYDASSPFSRFGPGAYLLRETIDDMVCRGFTQFDLGLGEASYKQSLGAQTFDVFSVTIAGSVRGRLAAAIVELKRFTKHRIKRSPRLYGVALMVRRAWTAIFG